MAFSSLYAKIQQCIPMAKKKKRKKSHKTIPQKKHIKDPSMFLSQFRLKRQSRLCSMTQLPSLLCAQLFSRKIRYKIRFSRMWEAKIIFFLHIKLPSSHFLALIMGENRLFFAPCGCVRGKSQPKHTPDAGDEREFRDDFVNIS
jgi:hypothetical protein